MIVWVASYPRSGNRFFRHTLKLIYGQASVSVYSDGTDEGPQAQEVLLSNFAASEDQMFVKTHDLPALDTYPTIYLLRDGRDSLVSYAWFHLTVDRKLEKADISPTLFRQTLRDMMLNRESTFGIWSDNIAAWTSRSNTVVVRFENLIANPDETVAEALATLKLRLPRICSSQMPTFAELRQDKPHLFRRGKIGSWQDEFPADLLDLFWQTHGDMMRQYGYCESETTSHSRGA
jgi:hypothetical protein